MWRETWIARRGCGFIRKRNSGKNSWWVCKGCGKGSYRCVRGRIPIVVDGVTQHKKYAYTSFTYENVQPCNCGGACDPSEVEDAHEKQVGTTQAEIFAQLTIPPFDNPCAWDDSKSHNKALQPFE